MITNKSKFFTHQVKNFFNINVKKKLLKLENISGGFLDLL